MSADAFALVGDAELAQMPPPPLPQFPPRLVPPAPPPFLLVPPDYVSRVDIAAVRAFVWDLSRYHGLLAQRNRGASETPADGDAGSPAAEELQWQLLEAQKELRAAKHADSLAMVVQGRLVRLVQRLRQQLQATAGGAGGAADADGRPALPDADALGEDTAAAADAAGALCIACLEPTACVVAVPCGHRCLCLEHRDCLAGHTRCPICRAHVRETMRIF